MGLELLVDVINGRLHAAVVRKGVLDNLYVDRRDATGSWASLYLGKVVKIDPRLDAAFVDLGGGLMGFLPGKHVHLPGADSSEQRTGIAHLLKPGQVLPVQVKSEAKKGSSHENNKLPRLTTKLYTFGQSLVYSPTSSQVTISRRITREEVLQYTTRLKGHGGWIVQASAENAQEDDVLHEAETLLEDWQVISTDIGSGNETPRLLRAGPDALLRVLNDYGAHSFSHIYAGNKKVLDMVAAWSAKYQPALATSKRLRLFKPEPGVKTLFEIYDLHDVIDGLSDPVVDLPSGGSIIIEPTQALVVIDVNQGSGTGPMTTNIEAGAEAARQIRLRNLNGGIIIDFINVVQRNDRARVVEAMAEACINDNAGITIHGWTRIGIIEVTRKRRSGMLYEKLKS